MSHMPRDRNPEATPALLHDGYRFIAKRCQRYGGDAFRTRLLMQSTVCLSGPAAARLFYDGDRFARQGAAPRRLRRTLFGEGAVQTMDGPAQHRRKQMFMALMTPDAMSGLAEQVERQWREAMGAWQGRDRVVLIDEARDLLCSAVCAWAGIRLEPSEVPQRSRELTALIESPGALGPPHWAGRRARQRAERWAARFIRAARADGGTAAPGTAVHTIAWHRDLDGALLDERVAAVELLNVLRPTVAVSRYVVFLAHALHEHPEYQRSLPVSGDDAHERFVQEVRRHYPFFPFAVARVRKDFDWYGYPFRRGERAMLDLYGTNHDPRSWQSPEQFRPDRFRDWDGDAFALVPQGGGDHAFGHRCAGEWITIRLMKVALRQLTGAMEYRVPAQDLRIDLSRMPALPRSGFVIDQVRARSEPSRSEGALAAS